MHLTVIITHNLDKQAEKFSLCFSKNASTMIVIGSHCGFKSLSLKEDPTCLSIPYHQIQTPGEI